MEVSEARGIFETLSERLNNSDVKKADKEEIDNLESQIKSLASGSPKRKLSKCKCIRNS